ncbi:MAG: diacylglycerol kinase, partial [Candidatus Omnitrophica bacterium]|nr:diacylglycerol kinase [Candidatus Omnitrophota bacterium]
VDLIQDEFHPLAMIIKDISAGAVFLAALNSLVIGYLLFSQHLRFQLEDSIHSIRQSPWHITFISFMILIFLVVSGKIVSKKGTPFRGGMPSGHAAFAFAIWVIVSFVTESGLASMLTFIMAFIIARHRVQTRIHTVWEVTAGALLGVLLTAFMFQILR